MKCFRNAQHPSVALLERKMRNAAVGEIYKRNEGFFALFRNVINWPHFNGENNLHYSESAWCSSDSHKGLNALLEYVKKWQL